MPIVPLTIFIWEKCLKVGKSGSVFGAALAKASRATFGRDAAIQRCQIHKARNILDRLPKSMHGSVRRVLRQAWEM